MTTPKQGVLFDLDGTLVDTLQDITVAFNKVLAEFDRPSLEPEALKPLVSHGSPYMIPATFDVAVGTPAYHDIRDKVLSRYQQENSRHSEVFSGITDLLQTINQRAIPWGVVTNKLEHLARETLERFNLMAGCQVLIGGDTFPVNKPHPRPLLEACQQLKLQPNQVIYIGDSERDVEAAHAAGIESITVEHGYRAHGFDAVSHLTTVIDEPRQILQWL